MAVGNQKRDEKTTTTTDVVASPFDVLSSPILPSRSEHLQGAPTRKTQAKTATKKEKKNALGSFTKEKEITLRLSDDSTNARASILGHWCDTAPTTRDSAERKRQSHLTPIFKVFTTIKKRGQDRRRRRTTTNNTF
jgi:hypothetical protein